MKNHIQLKKQFRFVWKGFVLLLMLFLFCEFYSGCCDFKALESYAKNNKKSTEKGDTANSVTLNMPRQPGSSQHPRVSPFMPKEIYDEMNKKLTTLIGDGKVPNNQLIFLYAKPTGKANVNPPYIELAFVAPEESISPDDIQVFIDENDFSNFMQYSIYHNNARDTSFYIGGYRLENYLNPEVRHEMKIVFMPRGNKVLQKNFSFNVPRDEKLLISNANFPVEKENNRPTLKKLQVFVIIPREIKIDEPLLKPSDWSLICDDGTVLPEIISVEGSHLFAYTLTFADKLPPHKQMTIWFTLSEGVTSNKYTFTTIGDFQAKSDEK